MNNQQISSFFCIVESNSFSKAEKKLYVSRQALKKQIDSLEAELGFSLFTRSHHGVTLTEGGEQFYKGMVQITSLTENLIKRCRDSAHHETTIRIGSPRQPRLVLENVFNEFSKKYPDIKQEVIFIDAQKPVEMLLNGDVDVSECIWRSEMKNPSIGKYKLMDMPYQCLVAPTHPLAGRSIITTDDLNGYTIGIRKSSNNELIKLLKDKCGNITIFESKGSGVDQQHIFTVCYNHGIFISRAYFTRFMTPLVSIPFDCPINAECNLLFRKPLTSATRKFLDTVKECFPSK